MATLRAVVQATVVQTLVKNGLNQSDAAKELDISRGTLRNILSERYGVTSKLNKLVLSDSAAQALINTECINDTDAVNVPITYIR